MSTALIDADIVAYRAAISAQENVDWGDGEEGPTVATRAAIANAYSILKTWVKGSRCTEVLLCFSPRDGINFRRALAPYKVGRGAKPLAYWSVVDALEADFKVKRLPFLEADDVMGIIGSSPKVRDAVVVTIDKDLLTIPCTLFNPLKSRRPQRIRPLEADRFWMFQTLTGDPVDGYKGCPGVGKVGATRLLDDCRNLKQMWHTVCEAYMGAGLTEDDALLQARLARILRREDYDKHEETIALWHSIPAKREFLTPSGLSATLLPS